MELLALPQHDPRLCLSAGVRRPVPRGVSVLGGDAWLSSITSVGDAALGPKHLDKTSSDGQNLSAFLWLEFAEQSLTVCH